MPFGIKLNVFPALIFCTVVVCCSLDSLLAEDLFPGFVYTGHILKNAQPGDVVELDEPLYVRNRNGLGNGEICGYTVYKAFDNLPFRIVLLESMTGSANIYVAPDSTIDQEAYTFEIAAHDCILGAHGIREKVLITVTIPTENEKLMWKQTSYSGEVFEGQIDHHIVRVEAILWNGTIATDADICRYTVLTPDVPFDVEDDGSVYNTKPLEYRARHEYRFELSAEGCEGQITENMPVHIKVKAICQVSWAGIDQLVEFYSGVTSSLMPNAKLLLSSSHCKPSNIFINVAMTGHDTEAICQLDSNSIVSQRNLCGLKDAYFDLLTDANENLLLDSSTDGKGVLNLNGVTDVVVMPLSKLDLGLGPLFVISVWLKHEPRADGDTEEQIVCMADGATIPSGCHLSLSLQERCHVMFAIHPERIVGDVVVKRGKLGPIQWRWRLHHVCDSQWHHYVISVQYPQVQIFVDGKEILDNAEIVHEWPISSSSSYHHSGVLFIGAAPHGAKHSMRYHFNGSLAGLTVWKNMTLTGTNIHCLSECREKLDFTAVDIMDDAMSVTVNNMQSEVTLSGNKSDAVVKLLRLITYTNTRTQFTDNPRNVTLKTHLTCTGGQHVVSKPFSFKVLVKRPENIQPKTDSYDDGRRILFAGEPLGILENKLSFDQIQQFPFVKSQDVHWPGVVAAACIGCLVVLIAIATAVNVSHCFRLHTTRGQNTNCELSRRNQSMNIVVNPLEEKDLSRVGRSNQAAEGIEAETKTADVES